MKPSLLAPFGEREQVPYLPASVRIHRDARDFQIVDRLISHKPVLMQRIFVAYDADRDLRTLKVLSAISYAAPRLCTGIVGMSETNGRLSVFYGDPLTVANAARAFGECAYKALYPADKWTVDVLLVPMRDGQLARALLPTAPPHPLLAAPAPYHFGLIGSTQSESEGAK